MLKRGFIFCLLLISLYIINFNYVLALGEEQGGGFGVPPDYASMEITDVQGIQDITTVNPSDIPTIFDKRSETQKQGLTGEQLSQVDQSKWGDLTQYNPNSAREAINRRTGSNIQSISGDLSNTKLEGNNLVSVGPDGKKVSIPTSDIISFNRDSNGIDVETTSTKAEDASGMEVSNDKIEIPSAKSADYNNILSSTDVQDFKVTLSNSGDVVEVKSASKIESKGSVFSNIIDSLVSLTKTSIAGGKIKSAKEKNNATVASNGANYTISYNKDQSFGFISAGITEFILNEGMTLTSGNIEFEATSNNSVLRIINKTYFVKNGILNYTTQYSTEQLEGQCEFSNVEINNRFAIVKLSPTITLCSGARYNYIDKVKKEVSFSIYNIGSEEYILGFESSYAKDVFLKKITTANYGFIGKEILLKNIIQYDRYPEKALFPAINLQEYNNLNLEFKSVIKSLQNNTITIIPNDEKIRVNIQNPAITKGTISETFSGSFIIRETDKARYASFSKDLVYPDYILAYQSFDKPSLKISDKTLTQETNTSKTLLAYEGNEFTSIFNRIKSWSVIKDFESFKTRFFSKK